jgi:hypothetical protein
MGTLRACAGRLRLNLGLGLYHRLHDCLLVVAIEFSKVAGKEITEDIAEALGE